MEIGTSDQETFATRVRGQAPFLLSETRYKALLSRFGFVERGHFSRYMYPIRASAKLNISLCNLSTARVT